MLGMLVHLAECVEAIGVPKVVPQALELDDAGADGVGFNIEMNSHLRAPVFDQRGLWPIIPYSSAPLEAVVEDSAKPPMRHPKDVRKLGHSV